MPLPAAPIAAALIRVAPIALAGWAVYRAAPHARRDQRSEDALDDLEEGLARRSKRGEAHASGRYVRTIRLGRNGPGIQIDAAAIGRFRINRVERK